MTILTRQDIEAVYREEQGMERFARAIERAVLAKVPLECCCPDIGGGRRSNACGFCILRWQQEEARAHG